MPPGGNGTTNVMGLLGQASPAACSTPKASEAMTKTTSFRKVLRMLVSIFCCHMIAAGRRILQYFVDMQEVFEVIRIVKIQTSEKFPQ
jgi:hypothetical protein